MPGTDVPAHQDDSFDVSVSFHLGRAVQVRQMWHLHEGAEQRRRYAASVSRPGSLTHDASPPRRPSGGQQAARFEDRQPMQYVRTCKALLRCMLALHRPDLTSVSFDERQSGAHAKVIRNHDSLAFNVANSHICLLSSI